MRMFFDSGISGTGCTGDCNQGRTCSCVSVQRLDEFEEAMAGRHVPMPSLTRWFVEHVGDGNVWVAAALALGALTLAWTL